MDDSGKEHLYHEQVNKDLESVKEKMKKAMGAKVIAFFNPVEIVEYLMKEISSCQFQLRLAYSQLYILRK